LVWGLMIHSGPSMVNTLEGECCVPETSANSLQMWCGRPSGCNDPFVWEKVCFGDSGDWKVWQVPCKLDRRCSQNGKLGRAARCKPVLKKQEDNCPTWMEKGVIVGFVAIACAANGRHQPLTMGSHHCWRWAAVGSHHYWQKNKWSSTMDAYKRGKILERKERAECAECERPKRESEGLPRAATLLSGAAVCESWELSLSEVILLLHVLCCNLFSISK